MKLPVTIEVADGRRILADDDGYVVTLEDAAKIINRQAAADKLAELVDMLVTTDFCGGLPNQPFTIADTTVPILQAAVAAYRSASG
jgi:hypothetical protein